MTGNAAQVLPEITGLNRLERYLLLSNAIVAYVAKCGRCGLPELYEIFDPDVDSAGARKEFIRRLLRLVETKRLQAIGSGDGRYWRAVAKGAGAGQPTPSRDNDVMRAPPYVPPPDQAVRAGALDYKRHASHGYQC